LSYRIGFKKSVGGDLKKIGKEQAERILRKIEQDLPDKADTFPSLTGKFAGLREFGIGTIGSFTLPLKIRPLY
jgi:mRNA-degrading endonuclease RelE of RelBE toxin-antitoxin system